MKDFSIEKYFVVGPENTGGRPVLPIIRAAVEAGFTFLQIRSKTASARELIVLLEDTSRLLREMGKSDSVALVADDRLDVVLAARERGAKVDGIHVGQSDIYPEICRKYLGDDAIVGLSAPTGDLVHYIEKGDFSQIDYFGAGPLHPTDTKRDCGLDAEGNLIVRTLDELTHLAEISPLPVTVGGGVKAEDLEALAATGIHGFFVVSAVAGADDPGAAARELVEIWDHAR
ncbi:thiamine-phosphate diphosphorylase [Peptoniphilus ivorii]|uniref:thiamine phosphate synthase n=1 Tax=Aedoeadaptatus ivorii TaxID=54006 RepID=UPI0027885D58|nr:thiamine phosphate synthase [Peptoniphilus ivorii]MDQ0508732.1 thiamine-phosphate diphosphorylase [Peptoniphilus ivorii]